MVCCSRLCRQLGLLIWKNFILQIRRPIGTAFELILPTLAVVFIIVLKFTILDNQREDRCFVTFDSDHLTIPSPLEFPPIFTASYHIYYSPNNSNASEIMRIVETTLPNAENAIIVGFSTEDEMVASLLNLSREGLPGCFAGGAGIVFDNLTGLDLEYTVRLRPDVGRRVSDTWQTRRTSAPFVLPGPRVNPNAYLSEGFLHIQNLVGKAIVQWRAQEEGITVPDVDISVRQLPYPAYTVDLFLSIVGSFLPLLLIMAFLYSAGITVKELVLEKELRIRESMMMMGLQQGTLWTSWYIKQFIFLFISVITMSLLLKFGQAFPKSDIVLLIIFFTLFITSIISFCFFVSVWFSSARIGLIIGFVSWFLNYMPVLFLIPRYDDLPLAAKVGSCVLSNTCMGLGVQVLSILELRGEGLLWSNFAQPLSGDDSFSMVYVCGMLLFDTVVYMLLAWYINGIKPGTYGIPKPWYFPFLPSYWIGTTRRSSKESREAFLLKTEEDFDPSAHEEQRSPPDVGISIKNLTKVYSQAFFSRIRNRKKDTRFKAVDNLNLDMYKGQITALLGHNGAGKTTTMSILTGLYTPSKGTATINGYSILTDMDQIRNSLGICPQHNVLFDRLTVREHLKFFMRLKGATGNVNAEVDAMIVDLQLEDKSNIQAARLSGGMKRKLSVGIALVGDSEVIILDEPTSGMDPYARRATWDLLVKHKQNRTILLTTHFMDEADLLGDRIAIMAEGKLKCSGSSLFLKSRYGVGYHMTIVKKATCDTLEVGSLIRSMVPNAEQVTDVGAELTFILPSDATPRFPDLFDNLEERKQELGIASFGVSVTTMEEVFIKVGEDTDRALDQRLRGASANVKRTPESAAVSNEVEAMFEGGDNALVEEETPLSYSYSPNSGVRLWVQQFWAMFLKRVYNSSRFWGAVVSQLLLPIGFVLFGLVLAVTVPSSDQDDPKRTLGLKNSAISPENISLFYAQFENMSNPISFNFSDLQPSWLGATDLLDYSSQVQSIIDQVNSDPPNTVESCCQYKHQILDGFCASRSAEELRTQCGEDTSFGYHKCLKCLSCCNATSWAGTLSSCSSPSSLLTGSKNSENFCPVPPKVSVSDTSPSGSLESENVFVAEYLLNISTKILPVVFFREVQAGFTVTKRDSPFSVCGCSPSSTSRQQECDFFSGFQTVNDSIQCPEYSFENIGCASLWSACLRGIKISAVDPCSILQNVPNCGNLYSNTSNICSSNSTLSSCYTVEGISADVLKEKACNTKVVVKGCSSEAASIRPIATTYVDQEAEYAATVWYNNQPYHMPAAALNTFHNVLLRKATGGDSYKLIVNNHPLPRNLSAQIEDAANNFTGFGIGIMVVFGYSFLLASFVLFLVKEKESKAKHLQFVSGVFSSSYWLATFAWDLLNASAPVLLSLVLFAAFQVDAFTGEGLAAIFILSILTCWSSIPFTYVFSFLFTNSLAAFGLLVLIFFFVAMLTLTVVFLVALNVSTDAADSIHYVFLLFPTYGLSAAFNDLYSNQATKKACSQPGAEVSFCYAVFVQTTLNSDTWIIPFDFQRPGIGIVLVYMLVEGFVFMCLTLLIERRFFLPEITNLLPSKANRVQDRDRSERSPLSEDEDVSAERRKVSNGLAENIDVVVLNNLRKTYRGRLSGCSVKPSKKAVRGISLAVPTGECFGLLGVNGAGKTTTFGIITGDMSMTSGSVSVAGYDITSNLRDVQQRIGYCPQFDALIDRLTGRELLTMFARLRGVPENQIKQIVNTEINRVDLSKYADKKCGSYSGGNKRKLSTAIALVGNPPIVLLDEPTTGMDPTTRRYTWDVLTKVISEGRSIILTSHSMEECEALCTRIAIMVNGSFKCLGSIQHLKNKFGAGFILQVKVGLGCFSELSGGSLQTSVNRGFKYNENSTHSRIEVASKKSGTASQPAIHLNGGHNNAYDTTSLHIFIREAFSGAMLLEEHQGAVTYQLPSGAVSWSTVFRLLEQNKERLQIVDYSVSQTTLEQVFINFAKEQIEDD